MNDLRSLSIGILLFMLGQVFTFYQLNGQFIWKWIEKNPLLVSLLRNTYFLSIHLCYKIHSNSI